MEKNLILSLYCKKKFLLIEQNRIFFFFRLCARPQNVFVVATFFLSLSKIPKLRKKKK